MTAQPDTFEQEIKAKLDNKTKPVGSLGLLEAWALRYEAPALPNGSASWSLQWTLKTASTTRHVQYIALLLCVAFAVGCACKALPPHGREFKFISCSSAGWQCASRRSHLLQSARLLSYLQQIMALRKLKVPLPFHLLVRTCCNSICVSLARAFVLHERQALHLETRLAQLAFCVHCV
jgi:hypothetical protein